MKKSVLAVILCTVLLTAGCTAPGAGSSGAQNNADAKQESVVGDAGKEDLTEAAETGLSGNPEGSADTASAADPEASEETADAAAATSQKAAEGPGAGTGETAIPEGAAHEASASSEDAVKAEETATAGETETSAGSEEEETGEEQAEKKSAGLPDKVVPGGGAASAYVFPEYPEEPIPDYYTPYGVWTLVYDSGFEVKTRYSEAGLTYYKESEEFFFRMNKDLPDFRAETAHMLFNTAGPMDPAEAGDEVFPYEEGYVIYVQLDDGIAYQISKWDLDLRGRIFVRELYESFRQKWEGAF